MSDIKIEVNGKAYTGFTSAIATKSLENMAGKFSFTTTVQEDSNGVIENDLKCQDKVKIFIGDDLFLTGKIESLNIASDVDSHSISVSGRDQIGDLLDSSIIKKSYKTRDFILLIKTVLLDNGYTAIKVFNDTIPLNLENKEDVKAEKGETIGGFINRYAEKLSVLVYSDEDGNLVVTREGDDIAVGVLLRRRNDPNSNIQSSSIDISITGRYKFIQLYSQGNNDTTGQNSVDQNAQEIDPEITSPRRKIINKPTASQTLSLKNLAKWNIAIRRARGARYDCIVQNFFEQGDKGFAWQINTLIALTDDICQVNGQFLIQGVTFRKTLQGTFTDISIVNRGSFSLDYDNKFKKTGDFAENLINTSLIV